MKDYNELKRSLSRRGQRPALDENGEPFLTRIATTPGVTFISAEQFVEELNKKGKSIHAVTLEISDSAPATPPPKKEEPKAEPKPEPKPKKVEVWTKKELEEVPWKDIRKLAKLWDDVPGNKSKDIIIEALTGKPKKGPA